MVESITAKIRPLANTSLEKASLLGAARVYVSKDALISLNGNLQNGKHCLVTRLEGNTRDAAKEDAPQEEPIQREATLWILPEKNISPNVVMITRAFQEATGFKIGDLVRIEVAGTTPDAEEVVVQDVTEKTEKTASDFDKMEKLEKESRYAPSWEFPIVAAFDRADLLFPGMIVEALQSNRFRRNLKVVSVNSQTNSLAKFNPASTAIIIADANATNTDTNAQGGGDLIVTGVPGMSGPITALNQFLSGFNGPSYLCRQTSCAFVIHGGRGTGKTFILKRIAETKWGKVHWIKHSDKVARIKETFGLALSQQPSIVLIDNLHALISKDRSNRDAVIDAMAEGLDLLSSLTQGMDALPKVVVVATCSDFWSDIPQELETPTRFSRSAALPIPHTEGRLEILESFDLPLRASEKQSSLQDLAQKTYAYSPRDLAMLASKAVDHAEPRLREAGVDGLAVEERVLEKVDLDIALRDTYSTAMRDINLNPPTKHWHEIGGQGDVKKEIQRMIKYIKNPTDFLRPPPKGLLLYGPPGCSKTLSAQAAATESGFNFFSVKGAELLNMYVGESERAVRALFARAVSASPSIIFLDEIDSMGGQRTGSGSSTKGSGAVNMLTALLTEMDGFEALSGVLVLGATNRPDVMDKALLRPGRFDRVQYVGPPDKADREAIFRVHLHGLPLASDVDIGELARLADGHSGAEIRAITNDAVWVAQERYDDDNTNTKLEVSMADLTTVVNATRRNITKQMLDVYDKWQKQYMMDRAAH
ncbi:hypothetical protein FSARC_2661 [Fusarium sarcochroum]|uniref:AAA+ ATPase domain-containing protein n=1 Tax=Fusarium sarcochroum TaxID=1208366 RepID=A0A8H4U652_9HYPO|nr:hypothetical protein FSARC_2661 [Fusarium sarcochroum]